jgi:hypothetical protein
MARKSHKKAIIPNVAAASAIKNLPTHYRFV